MILLFPENMTNCNMRIPEIQIFTVPVWNYLSIIMNCLLFALFVKPFQHNQYHHWKHNMQHALREIETFLNLVQQARGVSNELLSYMKIFFPEFSFALMYSPLCFLVASARQLSRT
ncbi:hypothetical protein ACJX0J_014175, partial [Zea mays]